MTCCMPFGRHRGALLDELPDDYLLWLAGLDDLREPLRSAIRDEVSQRGAERARAGSRPDPWLRAIPGELVGPALELVKVGLHELALRHHPDRGGDLRRMQDLNSAADALRGLLGEGSGR